jgi:hypothetical protein
MSRVNRTIRKRELTRKGGGVVSKAVSTLLTKPVGTLVNKAIDLLPVELHLPGGYQYCGPGTKLKQRLARGDPGINKLDQACKQHDIAYSNFNDTNRRSIADRALAEKAWQRVKSSDASIGERAAALAVTTAMKGKTVIGGGRRRRRGGKRKQTKKHGGNIRRKRRSNRKTGKNKPTVWSMIKKGGGLYLRPYRVY